jgi:hypothetical protein
MQWNTDPKFAWVALYRLCVIGLLIIILTVLLEHNVNVAELLPRLFAVCRTGSP